MSIAINFRIPALLWVNLNKQDVPLGTGVLDGSVLLTELKRQGFKGVLTPEYESWGIKQHREIVQCAGFMNKTCILS